MLPGQEVAPVVQFIAQFGAPAHGRMHCAPFIQSTFVQALVDALQRMSQVVPLPWYDGEQSDEPLQLTLQLEPLWQVALQSVVPEQSTLQEQFAGQLKLQTPGHACEQH